MILGWGLAGIFAISTIILSVVLYKVKSATAFYLPQETISTEMNDGQDIPETDSNSESVYIYQVDNIATEEEEITYNYAPNEQ